MAYIKHPNNRLSFVDIEKQMKEHKFLTERKKLEIRKLMETKSPPTSSAAPSDKRYDPYTFDMVYDTKTPRGHKPEMWKTGSVDTETVLSNEPPSYVKPESEQLKHVVPTGGTKHHINVEDISHNISSRRKSFIERLFGGSKNKTNYIGPK